MPTPNDILAFLYVLAAIFAVIVTIGSGFAAIYVITTLAMRWMDRLDEREK